MSLIDETKADEWQQIDSAPKGRVILLWAVTDRDESGNITNWKMATGHTPFDGPTEWTWDGYRLREWDIKPTHWQSLPSPPSDKD